MAGDVPPAPPLPEAPATSPARPANGPGLAGLVLGIAGVVGCETVVLGLLCGAAACVLGLVGRARAGRGAASNAGQALAGLVLGIVAVVLSVGWAALYVWMLVTEGCGGRLSTCTF